QKQAMVALLRSASFAGGQDNAPALVEALQMLEKERGATLLWVHGPQPVRFRASVAAFEQAATRLAGLPDLVLYPVEPGPNELLPAVPWAGSARTLPQPGTPRAALAPFFARASGAAPTLAIRRTQGEPTDGLVRGSDHIARLWARDRVHE